MSKEKIYILDGLGCANCAAKMERKIQELPYIQEVGITFATKQLKIKTDDPDKAVPEIQRICSSIEEQVKIIPKDTFVSKTGKKEKKGFFRQNAFELVSIIIGAALFTAGLVFDISFYFTLAICGLAYIILGWKVLLTAIRNICHGQVFDENFLMSLATIAAFCIGDFAEGAGVMLFYRIGEFFEHVAVEKSRSQIMDAVDMRPETVNLVVSENESSEICSCGCEHEHHHHEHEHLEHEHDHHEHEHHHHEHHHHHNSGDQNDAIHVIPAEAASIGDILLVRPGDRIPLDGIVIEGESRIDTSPVTGEPVPQKASIGTEVISGCVNIQGLLKIKVTKPLSESMVTRILDSVETAAAGKPRIDKFITRFAKIYTPIVVALAVLTAIIPSLITGEWSFWITTAITFLVISCPCALVISVPLAFFAGIGAASKRGILFKGGLAIEALRKIKGVVMDKTGTLTQGNFIVQNIIPEGDFTTNRLLAVAAACESASTHPIAVSITEAASQISVEIPKAGSIEEIAGKGIKAELPMGTALCGNAALLEKFHVNIDNTVSKAAGTRIYLALNSKFIGTITISDTLKADAKSAVKTIKEKGLISAILTGDASESANAVASQTGIDKVFPQLLPEDKLNAMNELRNEIGPVMFVGDGINDAPVLAGADVGAAMGSGADAAIEAADVVFMNSSVSAIPQSIGIARITGTIAMENVIFALLIKLLVILMGLAGFANIWAAVFADTGVAMLCILNSLRILWKKF